MSDFLVLTFKDYQQPAENLARVLGVECKLIDSRSFPDDESLIAVPQNLPANIIICRSLDHPNNKLIELILAVNACRAHGAEHVSLVAPYMCYMRQDKEFIPGQAISQQTIGPILAAYFNKIITVDPHLHRVESLDEVFPAVATSNVSAANAMTGFLRTAVDGSDNYVLIGPDEESEQWVSVIAKNINASYVIATKTRSGDRDVSIVLPEFDYNNKRCIIIDDMISTGVTVARLVELLKAKGAMEFSVLVTHALFAEGAEQLLADSGINNIWSTDTVLHPGNCISMAESLADACR